VLCKCLFVDSAPKVIRLWVWQCDTLVRLDGQLVSSSVRRRSAGDGGRFSHAGVHGVRSRRHQFADVRADLDRDIERFTNVGSGWGLTIILRFVIRIGQYSPLVGLSFIPTSSSLMPKHALINVFNPNDSMCFAWAVLSALHSVGEHAHRIWKYRPHLKSIDLSGLEHR
jgi:hypothetical protein